jgi:ribosome-binding protein aMBF1 (putative translation factor)
MALISDLHTQWLTSETYQKEYDALEDEFSLAEAVIAARARAGLTQEELAKKMGLPV